MRDRALFIQSLLRALLVLPVVALGACGPDSGPETDGHGQGAGGALSAPAPACEDFAGPFAFSCSAPIVGKTCIPIVEPSDPDGWSNNHFCWDGDLGIRWSASGILPGMRCTQITEGSEPAAEGWSNNYLCAPEDTRYDFVWSAQGTVTDWDCVRWLEPEDMDEGFNNNYLCFQARPALDDDPEAMIMHLAHRFDRGAFADLNGDRRSDFCGRQSDGLHCFVSTADGGIAPWGSVLPLSDANGWADRPNWSSIRLVDVTGDGLADLCGRNNAGIVCYPSTGTQWGAGITGTSLPDGAGWFKPVYTGTFRFADFNGDGRLDFLLHTASSIAVALSTGTGFLTPLYGPAWTSANGWARIEQYATIRVADIDGNGKADLCGRSATGVECWLWDGTGLKTQITGPAWSDAAGWNVAERYMTLRVADVNGDGRSDLCARGAAGLECHLSTGSGFGDVWTIPDLADGKGWNDPRYYNSIVVGDVDGDLKEDVCGRGAVGLSCWLSTGTGFGAAVDGPAWSNAAGWGTHSTYTTLEMSDPDGDGKADVCGRSPSGMVCARWNGNALVQDVTGPAWTDMTGWDVPSHYGSIRTGDWRYRGAETCNGRDDDWDGVVDDGNPDGGTPCDTGLIGECRPGDTKCLAGTIQCVARVQAIAEVCNLKDDDCDGATDEDFGTTTCGVGPCLHTVQNCLAGKQQTCNPLEGATIETCDGIDNDCDGAIDDVAGSGSVCQTGKPGVCNAGHQKCSNGGIACVADAAPTTETCNGLDDDCDGSVDEELGIVTCGTGVCEHVAQGCLNGVPQGCDPLQGASPEKCNGRDDDCDGTTDEGFGTTTCGKGACLHTIDNCSGGLPRTCDPYEGVAPEVCDGIDNDCDGPTDENLGATTCGKGPCLHTVENCVGGVPQTCDPLKGAVAETCDGADNDCDDAIDEDLGETTCGTGACHHTVQNCLTGTQQTCDPLEGRSDEVCDGIDNNCNGATDEAFGPVTCGEGECLHTAETCVGGVPMECDPLAGASDEVCDGLDNDCNGQTDEPFGVGAACTVGLGACAAEGTTRCGPDGASVCDGTPGAPTDEACDGIDNDCDGAVDDLGQTTCGLGACEHTVDNCKDATPTVCDPMEGALAEVCDGIDNDCDGATDDGTCETCEPGTTVPCQVDGQAGVRLCGTDGTFGECTPIVVEPVPETAEEADVVEAEDAWPMDSPEDSATPPEETIAGDDAPAKPDATGPDTTADVPAKPDTAQQDVQYNAEFPAYGAPGTPSDGCTAGSSAHPGALPAMLLLLLGLVAMRRRAA